MDAVERIEGLVIKARTLANERNELLAKVGKLEAELAETKQNWDKERVKAEELHNKIKIIKLAQNIEAGNQPGPELTELKRKINEYIKEIDSCLAMLNE